MKRALAALGLLFAAGCPAPPAKDRPAVELGQALFADRTLSSSTYNRFSCATCHAAGEEETGGRVHAAFPLHDVANRPDWFLGYSKQLLDATNFCLVYFMRGEALEPGDPDGDALYEYLVAISPDASPPRRAYTFVRNLTALPAGTDVANGEAVYDRTCRVCHGDHSTGHGRISTETTVLDETLSADYDQLFPGTDHDLIVTEKVRHGQFYGIGGNMPFFSSERLSDEDLADLEAFLGI